MCQIMKQIQIYPELTRIHLGYQQNGETNPQWRRRSRLEREMRDAENRERNELGQILAPDLAQQKAAERAHKYQA